MYIYFIIRKRFFTLIFTRKVGPEVSNCVYLLYIFLSCISPELKNNNNKAVKVTFLIVYLLYYFPLPFMALISSSTFTHPLPPQSPHCCPCPWKMKFFKNENLMGKTVIRYAKNLGFFFSKLKIKYTVILF